MESTTPNEVETPAALAKSLYGDLRQLAHRERLKTDPHSTLQTTALIHEAYLKLHRSGGWTNRQHFMRTAAITMKHVLVDAARARITEKRGNGIANLSLEDSQSINAEAETSDELILRVGDALQRLADLNPRLARVVECRFFAGFSGDETAEALEITRRTVDRDWVKARAWLCVELGMTI